MTDENKIDLAEIDKSIALGAIVPLSREKARWLVSAVRSLFYAKEMIDLGETEVAQFAINSALSAFTDSAEGK